MKITKIEPFQISWATDDTAAQRSAFVMIHTDDGPTGIGETSPMQGGLAALGVINNDLSPMLLGRDPSTTLSCLIKPCIR
jgi:L-alanine-DL-glutamate epimerase-like enolase superfamily enzyme